LFTSGHTSLLPFIIAASQDLIAERVFDKELTLEREQLRDQHPEVYQNLARHLAPEIAHFANSLREMDVEVEVVGQRQGEETSIGGGFRLLGTSAQAARTQFKDQFEQLEKTTGVTFTYDEQHQTFLPGKIALSFISGGEHTVNFSEVMSIAVSGPVRGYNHRTNIFSFDYTDLELQNQLINQVGSLPSVPILNDQIRRLSADVNTLRGEKNELTRALRNANDKIKALEKEKKEIQADLQRALEELKRVYPELYP
jgi:hypothetical protein